MAVSPLLAPGQPNGGPSTTNASKSKGKRVVNYDSSSDNDDLDSKASASLNGQKKKSKLSNGQVKGLESPRQGSGSGSSDEEGPNDEDRLSQAMGSGSKSRGRPMIQISEKEAEKLRKEAERLFEVRQNLPFYQGRKQILEEIMNNDTTIILGETGCGKSTQLPQLLHSHPISLHHYKKRPRIGVTQPRRLPAIALANRVAAESGTRVGDGVGYTVRFDDCSHGATGIRYLTEGVLMRELANGNSASFSIPVPTKDPELLPVLSSANGLNLMLRYDILIIDEAHERTLNTDFLCGALKKVQRIRKKLVELGATVTTKTSKGHVKELKLVVMSATLDPSKFVNFFETNQPALIVKGRMYDVSTQHLVEAVDDYIESAAKQVLSILFSQGTGDILVFMPGAEEIETCAEVLKRASHELADMQLQILPLYAQLPPTAQAAIFKPVAPNTRRVVIATNIAETSMTIPGVSYVVDTGFKKEKEYIYRTSGAIEHLKQKNVSKAAAWQRTGRAGRERAGHCYRLFTKDAFDAMVDFDAPEIQRCNLAAAVLQLIAMGQNPFDFEYIDNPGAQPIMAAFQTLAGLEAITSPTDITPLGRQMLQYPLDPAHARILIASLSLGCVGEIIDILSLADAGPVWVDKQNERDAATAAKSKFYSRDGDHLTGMNVLRAYLELKTASSKSPVRWAKENYINIKTLNSAIKVRQQLRELVQRHGHNPDETAGQDTEKVRRCLLSGMFMNTAVIQSDGTYRQSAGTLIVKIHPSSVLMSKKVPAIMYDELTITSAMYARNVSTFDQSWLLEIPWFRQAAGGR